MKPQQLCDFFLLSLTMHHQLLVSISLFKLIGGRQAEPFPPPVALYLLCNMYDLITWYTFPFVMFKGSCIIYFLSQWVGLLFWRKAPVEQLCSLIILEEDASVHNQICTMLTHIKAAIVLSNRTRKHIYQHTLWNMMPWASISIECHCIVAHGSWPSVSATCAYFAYVGQSSRAWFVFSASQLSLWFTEKIYFWKFKGGKDHLLKTIQQGQKTCFCDLLGSTWQPH